jgi:predicted DNA-binding transcriptional regulator YafY
VLRDAADARRRLRTGVRRFRVDRIEALTMLDERFRDEPGKTLADLFQRENAAAPEKSA